MTQIGLLANGRINQKYKSTLICPIYTFSLASNIIAYTLVKVQSNEKYFNHLFTTGKCRIWRK